MSTETSQLEDLLLHTNGSSAPTSGLMRTRTNTAEIDEAIIHPGSVKINVKGAFIVDQDAHTPASPNGGSHDTKDIRLPNHTAVVSHIAVDVGFPLRRTIMDAFD